MFTGIIESIGRVENIIQKDSKLELDISSSLTSALYIGQSLAHDGVCLTVEKIVAEKYQVTVIEETIKKTTLAQLKCGDTLNLERALGVDQRFDGHFVQGHVSTLGIIREITSHITNKDKEVEPSDNKSLNTEHRIIVEYNSAYNNLLVAEGSIALHGISLSLASQKKAEGTDNSLFSVCIIPYTYENTNIKHWRIGSKLNIEFDIIGKYVQNLMGPYLKNRNIL